MKAKPKKPASKMTRNKTISLDPEVKKLIEQLAKASHSTVSGWITARVLEAEGKLSDSAQPMSAETKRSAS